MANRTGQGSAVPMINRNTGVAGSTPVVQYSQTSGAARNAGLVSFTLADVMKDISTRFEDRLDIRAQDEAAREGALAGGQDKIPGLQDEATIRGRAFNAAARDAVITRVDLQGRKILSEYEEAHRTDAGTFKAKADAYLQGHIQELQQFDPRLAQRFGAEFTLRADAAEGRIKERHRAVVRDRQIEQALRYQIAVQDEMAVDAAALFSGRAEDAQATLARMTSNAARMIDTANQIGPDGQPLFSARERIAAERQAQQNIAEQIGLSWMRSQPDALQAFRAWQDGKAEIELVNEDGVRSKINLQEMLGASGYQMAGTAFMDTLRSELSLQNQIEASQDRTFKENSDQVYSELMVLAQGNPLASGQAGPVASLTLDMVEAQRRNLEPDRYLSLREIARGGAATVSDGIEFSRLSIADADGIDIREDARRALADKKLSLQDFQRLYESNSGRIDKGTKDPVQTGRDYLTKGLGALSQEIGLAQSASIGGADAEYDIEISAFMDKNKRQPTYSEARDIAENVRARYSVLSVQDSLLSLPLPRSMTQAEKLSKNLSAGSIEEKVKKTNEEFLRLHNGDVARRDADPMYLREIRLLKDYHDLLKLKEAPNGKQ